MGIRDELQTEVAAAFDTDLQDAVNEFTGSYKVRSVWDPVTETGSETQVTYLGRGVLARCKLRRIDGVNILHGDLKLTALVNEVTDKPAVGHFVTAPDPITGVLQRYEVITAAADSAGAAYSIQLRRA
ncbi:glutamate 5-kinase [Klebsiella michiganensis]|uniref:Glutamate 5-kinase n=1 Tax=Klebsiella michiganensis TaxID=1134687 RepID=A0AB35Q1J0_9ENTR|nr:glutamate 5-kinase [Klebsiella michiganensis]MBD0919506.1 glutamate 5-kinase [Klebsiella michiganensis]MBD0956586.1 glutamate 5-kinase [Klebsiella michiganensis]MBG2586621.1 glutamate 5-kinase [Klebsiella michiganensis]MBG2635691.1 glutamate 5-kinase [Klebsiella michiganensis]MBG2685642.1 glutamate 5-kinase [Klebsiella michiganensis]